MLVDAVLDFFCNAPRLLHQQAGDSLQGAATDNRAAFRTMMGSPTLPQFNAVDANPPRRTMAKAVRSAGRLRFACCRSV